MRHRKYGSCRMNGCGTLTSPPSPVNSTYCDTRWPSAVHMAPTSQRDMAQGQSAVPEQLSFPTRRAAAKFLTARDVAGVRTSPPEAMNTSILAARQADQSTTIASCPAGAGTLLEEGTAMVSTDARPTVNTAAPITGWNLSRAAHIIGIDCHHCRNVAVGKILRISDPDVDVAVGSIHRGGKATHDGFHHHTLGVETPRASTKTQGGPPSALSVSQSSVSAFVNSTSEEQHTTLAKLAHAIYYRFVRVGAPFQVNLGSKLRHSIGFCVMKNHPAAVALDRARTEIYECVAGSQFRVLALWQAGKDS